MLLNLITLLIPLIFRQVGIIDEVSPSQYRHRAPRVLFVGDSMCVGMKEEFEKITRESGWVGSTRCRVGTTSIQWESWIENVVTSWRPDIVLISLGTNDGWILDRIVSHSGVHRRVYELAGCTGARVVWVEPPKINIKYVRGIEGVRNLLHSNIPVRFESELFIVPPPGDGVHLTSTGYNMWMRKLWEWMQTEEILGHQENL